MKTLGCLIVIIIVGVGIFWLTSSPSLSDEDKARIVGEKVHRGWNHVQKYARNVQKGWKSADDSTDKANKPQR